jgi:hypothetical protein
LSRRRAGRNGAFEQDRHGSALAKGSGEGGKVSEVVYGVAGARVVELELQMVLRRNEGRRASEGKSGSGVEQRGRTGWIGFRH